MRTLGRRGMSPLIATVLLMAFAVALGGMIMNWSSDLGSKAALDCSGVKLDVVQFCHDDSAINIRVRNTGTQNIAALALNVANPGSDLFTIALQGSTLAKGESKTSTVPFLVADDAKVSITASVAENGVPTACPDPVVSRQPLPKC